jgi:LCP family protein required for cell wall assembly
MRTAVAFVGVLVLLAGSILGYVKYRLDQIHTQACPSCVEVNGNQPFNVLVVGDDSRADNTPGENAHFGSASTEPGAHSDTIKVVHINPTRGTASLLSIPRDTYVRLSGLSASWIRAFGTRDEKINAALNDSVDSLVQTVQNTFGIPIHAWVLINFNGLIDAVRTVGGINLDFPYPVRDQDQNGNNDSGLFIGRSGCQTLSGDETLALSRSRHYEYEIRPGVWESDLSGDLGRIERQNVVIEALIDKARSTFNPLTLNAFIGSVVHDLRIGGLSSADVLSLAVKYHGFSGSNLHTATIPTVGAGSAVGSVQVVEESSAEHVVRDFLGASPGTVSTPPLDSSGTPMSPTTATDTAVVTAHGATTPTPIRPVAAASGPTTSAVPNFDPRPC